jgi:arsenical pump membrane protein
MYLFQAFAIISQEIIMGIFILAVFVLMLLSLSTFPWVTIFRFRVQTYWLLSTFGALVLWVYQDFSLGFLLASWTGDGAINPLRILTLFFALTFLATFLDEVGFIRYLAYEAMQRAGGSQKRLFFIWFFVVAFATMLTANDVVILTLTPFIIYFARHAGISPIPYLVAQFISANTWSMMLIIGNPTNIYLATMFQLDFLGYLQVMFFPTLLTGLTAYGLLQFVFKKTLQTPIENAPMFIHFPHSSFREGVTFITIAIVSLAVAQPLQIGMDVVTVICAFALILVVKIRHPSNPFVLSTLKRLPYSLIAFFLSMAMLVEGLNLSGLTMVVYQLLEKVPSVYGYGLSSFVASNLMNNIPMSLWFVEMIQQQNVLSLASVYATIIGSNLGALLTPVGALAGLMWLAILKTKQVKFGLMKFVQYGLGFGIPLLLVALLTIDVILG